MPFVTSKNLDELPVYIRDTEWDSWGSSPQFLLSQAQTSKLPIHCHEPLWNRQIATGFGKNNWCSIDVHVAQVIEGMPATPARLQEVCQAQEQDIICQQLMLFYKDKWPHHSKVYRYI